MEVLREDQGQLSQLLCVARVPRHGLQAALHQQLEKAPGVETDVRAEDRFPSALRMMKKDVEELGSFLPLPEQEDGEVQDLGV